MNSIGPHSLPRRRKLCQSTTVRLGKDLCSQVLVVRPEALCTQTLYILHIFWCSLIRVVLDAGECLYLTIHDHIQFCAVR